MNSSGIKTDYPFCARYDPITVSNKDTAETLKQVRIHNTKFTRDCPAWDKTRDQ